MDRGGSGAASAVFNREREEIGRAVWRKGMVLTGGPHLSATSKREGEGRGRRLGQAQEGGAGEVLGRKAEYRERERKKFLFLFFLYQIFQLRF